MKGLDENEFSQEGKEIGDLVKEKNEAYGDSFALAGQILRILYPNGIKPNQYDNMMYITRVLDKIFRIATDENALGENPKRDIAGYSILGVVKDKLKKEIKNEAGTSQ